MPEEVYEYEEDQVDSQLKLMASYGINGSVTRFLDTTPSVTDLELNTCMAIALGVNRGSGVGQSVYQSNIAGNTGLPTVVGFNDTGIFGTIESGIRSSYFGSYSSTAQDVIPTITTACLMGAYVAGVDNDRITGFLNRTFSGTYEYFGFGPTGNIFSDAQISSMMANDFSGALVQIMSYSPKNTEVNKIYFRIYDIENSFSSDIDLQMVKDAAMQYYAVSGELNYENFSWSEEVDCIDQTIPIFAENDFEIISDSVKLGPTSGKCLEQRLEPVTGTYFYRKFVDGPYSTGDYTSTISELYQSYDKAILDESSYSDNRKNLYTLLGENIARGLVPVDTPFGEYYSPYDKEINEYAPTDGQRIEMHLGNIAQRSGQTLSGFVSSLASNPSDVFESLVPVYRDTTGDQTGIKLVPISLNPQYWSGHEIVTNAMNPITPDGKIYQNALNFNPSHVRDFFDYKSEDYFNEYARNIADVSGICGPPQRDWISDFPYITITQNFQSETTNKYADIYIGFAASFTEAQSTTILGFPVSRITKNIANTTGLSSLFQSQNYTSPDEPDQTKVDFGLTINSSDLGTEFSGDSFIKSMSLGIGNNMDGGQLLKQYTANNAGWSHSGYIYTGISDVSTTGLDILGNFAIVSGYSGLGKAFYFSGLAGSYPSTINLNGRGPALSGGLIGSRQKKDKFLIAWSHPTYGHVDITRMYAYSTGSDGVSNVEYIYSGFDSGYTDTITDPTGVFPRFLRSEGFAGMSTGTVNGLLSSGWTPIFKEQRRENSFPRYYRGPYATSTINFLYSGAEAMFTGHTGYQAPNTKLLTEPNQGDIIYYNETGGVYSLPTGQYPSGGFNQSVGFPHQIEFDMVVKEYVTKEFYKQRNWSKFGVPFFSDYSSEGISPVLEDITWSETNSITPTNCVDTGFATPIAGPLGGSNTFHMGFTGVNPLIYNSVPNYIHGNINDEIGSYSGTSTQNSIYSWPDRFRDETGAYLVRWQETLSGSSYGDAKTQNPEANHTLYSTYTIRVTGYYTPPGWIMRSNRFEPAFAKRVFTGEVQNLWGQGLSGNLFGFEGSDPLFYERVGGFSGDDSFQQLSSEIPEQVHGGNHSQGMIGDSWLSFNFDRQPNAEDPYAGDYGYGVDEVSELYWDYYRAPWRDKEVFITDIKHTGLAIYFTALKYFPNSGRLGVTGFTDAFNYFKSGVTQQYESGVFDIENKTFSFTGSMLTGTLFRMPSGVDWSGVSSGGNVIYPSGVTGWSTTHTGEEKFWRHQAKMDITIQNVNWTGRGMLPFDMDYLVQPSGYCNITGQMTYEQMAEQPIYSEGIVLRDITPNDIAKEYGQYPVAISNTLKDHGFTLTTSPNEVVENAPSKQLQLKDTGVKLLSSSTEFKKINVNELNYNKYKIIANSDYSYLNVGTMPSYEGSPLLDHEIFTETTLLFSAQQGQELEGDRKNDNVQKIYNVEDQRQYYDGIITDATLDDRFSTNYRPTDQYEQPTKDYFVPEGLTIAEIEQGWY